VVYGPLANGATSFMYEGRAQFSGAGPLLAHHRQIRREHLYTAPTAIRAFMKWGGMAGKHDLSSLRLLGTVGEPINPEAWMWYHEVIGHKRCPIVDTWWQTETGGIMITPLPGATRRPSPAPPRCRFLASCRKWWMTTPARAEKFRRQAGHPQPWPSMLRGVWGDPKRFVETYWSEVKGSYFTGDGCRQDKDGYFWIVGRIDDVLNVAGHRIGTAEVESALVSI
jgi:acetyl-CoA synthetase